MLFLIAPVLLFCGCSSPPNENTAAFPLISAHKPVAPFSTKEPEQYRADVIIRSEGTERKYSIARDGDKRRTDFDTGGPQQRTILEADRNYLINVERKVFAVLSPGAAFVEEDFSVHTLNQGHYTEFESTGSEDGLAVYRAEIDGSPASEVSIHIDPSTNLPMKQEFYSVDGGRRELVYTVELQNVALEVTEETFVVPRGFREISLADFRKRSR